MNVLLSICIATFNRAAFIGQTLESIIYQITDDVEIVIVDGASSDNTSEVVSGYAIKNPKILYYKQEINRGVDEDFNYAVYCARGKYCWLMSDDDVLKPGAIKAILSAIKHNFDLIIVNSDVKNSDLSKVLDKGILKLNGDRIYMNSEHESLFINTANYLSYIGCVVIRKEVWDSRDKIIYFGTLFIHVGVIFQKAFKGNVLVIAKPYVTIRCGNAQWSAKGFEIWMCKWPKLIWSFNNISCSAKRSVCKNKPWKKITPLLLLRGLGSYSIQEYKKYILPTSGSLLSKLLARVIIIFPGKFINILAILYYSIIKISPRMVVDLKISKYYWRN